MVTAIDTAWVLKVEDVRDQSELWADVSAEAGLNAMTAATGLLGCRRHAIRSQRSSCWTAAELATDLSGN